jgi:hypothetical protein
MGIISLIKRLLPSRRRALLSRIKDLPAGRRLAELGAVFYNACLERAVQFVQDHIARLDSPFRGVPRERFFHEVMAVNFWVVERLLAGKQASLMERIYGIYESSFPVPRNGSGNVSGGLAKRHAVYSASWNDVTGHQDVFGLRVAEQIFGPGRTFPVPEASFWIISYTHEVMDDLAALIRLCRGMKIPLS